MIRTLLMIAVAGFLVSAVTLSVAVAITGPAAIIDGAWSWGPHGWGWRHHDRGKDDRRDDGPQATRDVAWSGGDHLVVSIPAAVTYTQAEGPAKVTISGPSGAVADVRVEDGRIRYDDGRDDDDREGDDQKLKITISAPAVTDFTLDGDESLAIAAYKQDRLDLTMSGHAEVKAAGAARDLHIRISGSARADLGGLKVKSATVGISGSGEASLAPTDAADVEISGSGDVTLLTDPPRLHSSITGSGRVHRPDA